MSAIAALADTVPEKLMSAIDDILRASDASSVIAKDKAMAILARLNAEPRFHDILTPVILQRLATATVNQTPMYAEMAAESMQPKDLPRFREIVRQRQSEISYPAKKARLEKLLRRLEQGAR